MMNVLEGVILAAASNPVQSYRTRTLVKSIAALESEYLGTVIGCVKCPSYTGHL